MQLRAEGLMMSNESVRARIEAIALAILPIVIKKGSATPQGNFDVGGDVGQAFNYAEVFLAEWDAREAERDHFAGITVNIADAKAAGLCDSGVKEWLKKNAQGRTEMPLNELRIFGMADGDNQLKIEAVIEGAVMRHEAATKDAK